MGAEIPVGRLLWRGWRNRPFRTRQRCGHATGVSYECNDLVGLANQQASGSFVSDGLHRRCTLGFDRLVDQGLAGANWRNRFSVHSADRRLASFGGIGNWPNAIRIWPVGIARCFSDVVLADRSSLRGTGALLPLHSPRRRTCRLHSWVLTSAPPRPSRCSGHSRHDNVADVLGAADSGSLNIIPHDRKTRFGVPTRPCR